MPDAEKNDPEAEAMWRRAKEMGLVGSETAYVVHRDEKGIVRIARRIERCTTVEYPNGDGP